jgi:hypothetical protein
MGSCSQNIAKGVISMAFPSNTTGMLTSAVVLAFGLFLIGSFTSGTVTITVGLIMVIVGAIGFAL